MFLPNKKLVPRLPLNQGPAATPKVEIMGHPATLKNSFLRCHEFFLRYGVFIFRDFFIGYKPSITFIHESVMSSFVSSESDALVYIWPYARLPKGRTMDDFQEGHIEEYKILPKIWHE